MGDMISSAFKDMGKNMFSPAALLTGGASLAVTGMKQIREDKKEAAAAAAKASLPPPAPQAPKTPDRAGAVTGSNGSGGGSQAIGPGTLLTGPGGVDPTALNLGKNTLLGQ